MKRYKMPLLMAAAVAACISSTPAEAPTDRPNVLIIHTDEHNFRTLGCYRDLMSEDQAYVWGPGVKVDTPNIDSLARAGAMCANYYVSSPVCTPSRASFVSGLYPIFTGSPANDLPLNDDIVTFAELFQRNGYATSYVGKWHLDGEAKPGFTPKRQFGFEDNRYMFNRGHWKNLEDTEDGPAVRSRSDGKPSYDVGDADEISYTTDFLVDRTIDVIKRDKDKPFCVMLSIPDPHGPNTVRSPYDTMFGSLEFQNPRTMSKDMAAAPAWAAKGGSKAGTLKQQSMQNYFGMVKCIDDNVGKLLKCLADLELDRSTSVVFTSDHGDLMGEHGKHNKGLPYETSARVPFIIRYPGKIPVGKVIRTAHCNVDFPPMILSLAGIRDSRPDFHGKDTSAEFLRPERETHEERIVYSSHAGSQWVAAMDGRHKLVFSTSDVPWLYDLKNDPDELVNVYTDPDYASVAGKMKDELLDQIKRFKDPIQGKLKL